MAIAPAYTNEKCFCERGNYGKGATKIVCGEAGGPQHWAHVRCLKQWAQQKRTEDVPDGQITCPLLGNGGCNTNLAHLLPPLPQKSYLEQASDFFRGRPVAGFLAVSLPAAVLAAGLFGVGAGIGTVAAKVIRGSVKDWPL